MKYQMISGILLAARNKLVARLTRFLSSDILVQPMARYERAFNMQIASLVRTRVRSLREVIAA